MTQLQNDEPLITRVQLHIADLIGLGKNRIRIDIGYDDVIIETDEPPSRGTQRRLDVPRSHHPHRLYDQLLQHPVPRPITVEVKGQSPRTGETAQLPQISDQDPHTDLDLLGFRITALVTDRLPFFSVLNPDATSYGLHVLDYHRLQYEHAPSLDPGQPVFPVHLSYVVQPLGEDPLPRDADLFKQANVAAADLLIRLMYRHVEENQGHAWIPQDSVHSLERIARDKASPIQASMLRNRIRSLPKPPPISQYQTAADVPQRRHITPENAVRLDVAHHHIRMVQQAVANDPDLDYRFVSNYDLSVPTLTIRQAVISQDAAADLVFPTSYPATTQPRLTRSMVQPVPSIRLELVKTERSTGRRETIHVSSPYYVDFYRNHFVVLATPEATQTDLKFLQATVAAQHIAGDPEQHPEPGHSLQQWAAMLAIASLFKLPEQAVTDVLKQAANAVASLDFSPFPLATDAAITAESDDGRVSITILTVTEASTDSASHGSSNRNAADSNGHRTSQNLP